MERGRAMRDTTTIYGNMPLTLERHFADLAERHMEVHEVHSLWLLLRKDLEDRLPHSRSVFVHYSLHDANHSRSVIRAIERFLGDDRISQLSATNTFMLLCCAYAHDYGMAVTFSQIYDALGDLEFEKFVEQELKDTYNLDEKNRQAFQNLCNYIKEKEASCGLQELYFAIMIVIQEYMRPAHWKGVRNVWNDFKGLLEGRLNGRFIQGQEGIIDICEAHGKSFQEVLKLSIRADGIIGDEFHPRFIAAMLRLGDLLDLDNGRFPRWFIDEIGRNSGLIPHLSTLHYEKHEAVTHLLITPKRIEVCASCCGEEGYEVAGLVSEWIDCLKNECGNQIQYWSEITQVNFGRPPKVARSDILLDGKPYTAENRKLQMRMSQDRVMKLLEGTSIYQDQYVCIRELVQNAVDTSLLQLWYDITHNRYTNLSISKFGHKSKLEETEDLIDDKKEMRLLEHGSKELQGVFENYSITVELIEDRVDQKVYIVVKDKGTGIAQSDIRYMSDIGASKEKNERIVGIMNNMPRWLKPSGIFGIGLQSAFQLTGRIEFFTRRPNEPERLLVFHSYGCNHGKIEVQEVPPDDNGIFYDNAIPGTNVKIAINPDKLLFDSQDHSRKLKDALLFYDMEFDEEDSLHAMYVELSQIIEQKLREYPYDYFNIYFHPMIRRVDGVDPEKGDKQRLRCSYFAPLMSEGKVDQTQKKMYEDTVLAFYKKNKKSNEEKGNRENQDIAQPYSFFNSKAYYADEENCRIYRLEVREGHMVTVAGGKRFQLPDPVRNLYRFQYKFNRISNSESIYPISVRNLRDVHAGFLYWDINILDDKPDKYLNIDRDRLREGAVLEEELTYVRKEILDRWCDYLIESYQKSEELRKKKEEKARSKYEHEGRPDEFKPGEPQNIYKEEPRTLVSLALLFYQNVPFEKFYRFIMPYQAFLKEQEFMLVGEDFCVDRLWDDGAVFQSCFAFPKKWAAIIKDSNARPELPAQKLHTDTISRLPHRLIRIAEIALNSRKELAYYLKLGQHVRKPYGIRMDAAACLHDYCGAVDPDPSNKYRINLDSLVRKVFKPDRDFPNLLVFKYPKTFKRGRNFSMPLDHCIRWYILSPFDRELTRYLNQYIVGDNLVDSKTKHKIEEDLKKYAGQKNGQMERCINYVYKQHRARTVGAAATLPENLELTIRNEYMEFLKKCCFALIDYREVIGESFKNDQTAVASESS